MGVLDGKELEVKLHCQIRIIKIISLKQETIKVLEKPLEKRTKHELGILINLTKDIPFFKEYRDKG